MIDQHTQNKHTKKIKKGDSVAILFANKHIEQANTQLWIYPRQKNTKTTGLDTSPQRMRSYPNRNMEMYALLN